jgi:hypothetical protein
MDDGTKAALNGGPRIARSDRKTLKYGKRIIFVFIVCVAVVLFFVTIQAHFKLDSQPGGEGEKSYRTPSQSGFAELAASMRKDRQQAKPVQVSHNVRADRTQRIVIQGKPEKREIQAVPALPLHPRYYSNDDDAEMARTLRTMKIQAMTSRPVVENFKVEGNEEADGAREGTVITGASVTPDSRQIIDAASLAALTQQQGGSEQNPDPNGQAGKQEFLRGADGEIGRAHV